MRRSNLCCYCSGLRLFGSTRGYSDIGLQHHLDNCWNLPFFLLPFVVLPREPQREVEATSTCESSTARGRVAAMSPRTHGHSLCVCVSNDQTSVSDNRKRRNPTKNCCLCHLIQAFPSSLIVFWARSHFFFPSSSKRFPSLFEICSPRKQINISETKKSRRASSQTTKRGNTKN